MQRVIPTPFIKTRVIGRDNIAEPTGIPHEVVPHLSEVPHLGAPTRFAAIIRRLMSHYVFRSENIANGNRRSGPCGRPSSRLRKDVHEVLGSPQLSRERILATLQGHHRTPVTLDSHEEPPRNLVG